MSWVFEDAIPSAGATKVREEACYMQVGPVIGFYCIVDDGEGGCREFIDEALDHPLCLKHYYQRGILKYKPGTMPEYMMWVIKNTREQEAERKRIQESVTILTTSQDLISREKVIELIQARSKAVNAWIGSRAAETLIDAVKRL